MATRSVPRGVGTPAGAAAEQLAQRQCRRRYRWASCSEAKLTPLQHLDAVLRVVHGVVQRERGGRRGRERVLGGRLVRGTGRCRQARAAARSAGRPWWRTGAVDPPGTDRSGGANWSCGSWRSRRPCRCTRRLRRRLRPLNRVAARSRHAFCTQTGQEVLRRDDRIGEPTAAKLAGEVERGEPVDGDARAGPPRAGTTRRRRRRRRRGRLGQRNGWCHRTGPVWPVAPAARRPPWAVLVSGPGVRGSSATQAVAGPGESLAGVPPGDCRRAGGQRARSAAPGQGSGPGGAAQRGGEVGHRAAVQGDGEDAEGGEVVEERGAGPLAGDGYRGGALAQSRRDACRACCSCVIAIGTTVLPFL